MWSQISLNISSRYRYRSISRRSRILPHVSIPSNPSSRSISSSPSTSSSSSSSSTTHYDAIIIGGGHNGLVASNYLAKQGKRVLIVERRPIIGGAAVTEEIIPGFKFSRASYVYSLFRPQIVDDLSLKSKYGLELLPRSPSSFTPTAIDQGKSLLLGNKTLQEDQDSIAQFSTYDAQQYPKYNALLDKYSDAIRPLLDIVPPDPSIFFDSNLPLWLKLENIRDTIQTLSILKNLGTDSLNFWEFLQAPANKFLDRWFENPLLKATLATDAIIGAMVSPNTPSSAYVLLHHVMCGTWANVRGGMGGLTQALSRSAIDAGVDIKLNTNVKQILTESISPSSYYQYAHDKDTYTPSKVCGIECENGTIYTADRVLSNAAPSVTYRTLLGKSTSSSSSSTSSSLSILPPSVHSQMNTLNVQSGSVKINIALDRLPNFRCKPLSMNTLTSNNSNDYPHLRGTIHFEIHPEQIESAYIDTMQGKPSHRPIIEMTIPSVLDSTLAPPGKHVCLLFVQYAPYAPTSVPTLQNQELKSKLIEGDVKHYTKRTSNPSTTTLWDTVPHSRQAFAESVFKVIEEYAPGFTSSIIGGEILVPPDLESLFGLPGGNIFHCAMGIDQLFWTRPIPQWAKYRTPIKGLYLAGAGTHPGGGVMGAVGRNVAKMVLDDIQNNH